MNKTKEANLTLEHISFPLQISTPKSDPDPTEIEIMVSNNRNDFDTQGVHKELLNNLGTAINSSIFNTEVNLAKLTKRKEKNQIFLIYTEATKANLNELSKIGYDNITNEKYAKFFSIEEGRKFQNPNHIHSYVANLRKNSKLGITTDTAGTIREALLLGAVSIVETSDTMLAKLSSGLNFGRNFGLLEKDFFTQLLLGLQEYVLQQRGYKSVAITWNKNIVDDTFHNSLFQNAFAVSTLQQLAAQTGGNLYQALYFLDRKSVQGFEIVKTKLPSIEYQKLGAIEDDIYIAFSK